MPSSLFFLQYLKSLHTHTHTHTHTNTHIYIYIYNLSLDLLPMEISLEPIHDVGIFLLFFSISYTLN